MYTERFKDILDKDGQLICIVLIILPVLFTFYNGFFDVGNDSIWTESYPIWGLLAIGGIVIFFSKAINNKWALMAFSPILFYIIQAIGVTDGYWQMYLEYGVWLSIFYSFGWLVYKGHVRSLFFLFLLLFCWLIYSIGFAFLLGLTYAFAHFLLFVVKDNLTVFTILGKNKSAKFLGKAFLYWTPMLLFILPLKYVQNTIENSLKTQVYTNTLLDSTQFVFQQEFSDSLFNDLIPNKNQTTILFVEQLEKKEVVAKGGDVAMTMAMAPLKPSVINQIDEKQVLIDDTLAYDIITHVLPKYDTLRGKCSNIYFNQIFSNTDELIDLTKEYDLITSLEAKGDLQLPFVMVLQDLCFEKSDRSIDEIQPNLEISSLIAIKRLELSIVQSIESEAGKIDFSVLNNLDEKGKKEIEKQRKRLVNQINDHKNAVLKTVEEKFNSFFSEPFLELEKCKFWQIKKLIANEIRHNINKRYTKEKKKAKSKIDRKITKIYLNITDKVDYQFKKASQKMEELTDGIDTEELAAGTTDIAKLINVEVKNAVDEIIQDLMDQFQLFFGSWFFYSLIGTIAFYFLVIQTFLYIFARISISKKNQLFASLNTTGKAMPKGTIKKCGDTYTIAAAKNQVYYASRIYEPSGKPPKFSVPFKGISIYRRLKARAYTMNKIDMSKSVGSVHFRAIGSSEFVEWTLKEGEEVVFDYKNFVAISDTVTLKADVSLRVTTLILGRLFHTVAVGPGKLILMTKGRPIISGEKSSNASLAQNRILAWNKGTNFDVDTELGLTDVYLSGFYLQKMPKDLVIIDADAKGKANLGLIQYIKGLLWPF